MNYRRPGLFGGFSIFPPVIKILLVSNITVFILFNVLLAKMYIGGIPFEIYITKFFALNPIEPVAFRGSDGGVFTLNFYPWQIFTYMFMHGGFMHLLINMFILWMFGVELENLWGSKRFLFYYLMCGVGAGLANLFIAPMFTSTGPTVGASGAIYGILAAFAFLFPNRLIYIYFLIPVKAKYLIILYMFFDLLPIITGQETGVAHVAHLGGAVVGIIYLLYYYKGTAGGFFGRSDLKSKFTSYMSSPGEKKRESTGYSKNGGHSKDISDAVYKDLKEENNDYKKELEQQETDAQKRIDDILDKLSEKGYGSLTDEEKRILFQESKRLR
jgi:membrane associated rhomboid family serine protease